MTAMIDVGISLDTLKSVDPRKLVGAMEACGYPTVKHPVYMGAWLARTAPSPAWVKEPRGVVGLAWGDRPSGKGFDMHYMGIADVVKCIAAKTGETNEAVAERCQKVGCV